MNLVTPWVAAAVNNLVKVTTDIAGEHSVTLLGFEV